MFLMGWVWTEKLLFLLSDCSFSAHEGKELLFLLGGMAEIESSGEGLGWGERSLCLGFLDRRLLLFLLLALLALLTQRSKIRFTSHDNLLLCILLPSHGSDIEIAVLNGFPEQRGRFHVDLWLERALSQIILDLLLPTLLNLLPFHIFSFNGPIK